jgi:hypothetical protein
MEKAKKDLKKHQDGIFLRFYQLPPDTFNLLDNELNIANFQNISKQRLQVLSHMNFQLEYYETAQTYIVTLGNALDQIESERKKQFHDALSVLYLELSKFKASTSVDAVTPVMV